MKVSAYVQGGDLAPARREEIAREIEKIVTATVAQPPPHDALAASASPVRVMLSFDGVHFDGHLPPHVRAAADDRIAAMLGAGVAARHRPAFEIGGPPGTVQSLADIDPLPSPQPGSDHLVIAVYMKTWWGNIEDTLQLLVYDLPPHAIKALALAGGGRGSLSPDDLKTGMHPWLKGGGPGDGDPGPGSGPGGPPPPTLWAQVGLRLGGTVNWAKRIWAWNSSTGMTQCLEVDYQYPQWSIMSLSTDRGSQFFADSVVFEKPKTFGVWTPMYNFEVSRFWRLFAGKSLLFTWLQD